MINKNACEDKSLLLYEHSVPHPSDGAQAPALQPLNKQDHWGRQDATCESSALSATWNLLGLADSPLCSWPRPVQPLPTRPAGGHCRAPRQAAAQAS
jgi:hypothetical protein